MDTEVGNVEGRPRPVDPAERPDSLAARLGERVRLERQLRGIKIADLARATGLSRTIITRIEAGRGNPSLDTLWRLHRALGVPLSDFVTDRVEPEFRIVPARSGEPLAAESGLEAWLVHAEGREHRSDVYELDLPAGIEHRSDPHRRGTTELVVCTKGRMTLTAGRREAQLAAGDAVWFQADVPHVYRAARAARALCHMFYGA